MGKKCEYDDLKRWLIEQSDYVMLIKRKSERLFSLVWYGYFPVIYGNLFRFSVVLK